MIAILSATEHDYYAMPLPFVTFSWLKLGVYSLVFIPKGDNPKLKLAIKYSKGLSFVQEFECEEKRIPTYSQVIRNFGAAIAWANDDQILITGDSDMAVFSDYFSQFNDGHIHIVGADLTPTDQYPMCFAAMSVTQWREVMGIHTGYQNHVAELIDPIEGCNIRGEQWSYDQWHLKKKLDEYGGKIRIHPRAKSGTQFASKRADRDGWHFDPSDLIDAHLPRPLTDRSNFDKVYDLFKLKYPEDDLRWMIDYYNEYILL